MQHIHLHAFCFIIHKKGYLQWVKEVILITDISITIPVLGKASDTTEKAGIG